MLAITFWEAGGRLIEANQSFCNLLGCTPEQVRAGRVRWSDVTPPELLARDQKGIDEINATGVCTPYEKVFIHRDGRRVPLLVGGATLGERGEGVAFAIDLTESKRAKEELRRSHERLAWVLDATGVGLWFNELPFGRLNWDTRTREMFFVPPGVQPTIELFWERLHPDDREPPQTAVETALCDRTLYTIEHRVVSPATGEVRWIRSSGKATYAADGTPVQFDGINYDITHRKRAEEALAAAHRQIQSIIDNTPAIVYAFDLEERFVLANTAVAELLNSTPAEMIGKRRHEFMPKEDADWHEANDREAIRAGRPLEFEEYSQLQGQSITWLTTKFPLRDALGRIYAVAGISVDISERKRAEQEAQKAKVAAEAAREQLQSLNETLEQRVAQRTAQAERLSRQLRGLVAEVSQIEQRERRRLAVALHENLQQLLLAARMKLRALQGRTLDEGFDEAVQRVDEILDACVAESRSVTVQLSPPVLYDIGLLPALEWLARQIWDRHNLLVRVECVDQAEPSDENIRVLLFHAVRELLANVVKHSGVPCASIQVSRLEGDQFQIVVRDQGTGVDPATLETRMADAGAFGLFGIRQRLELVGGKLEVQSRLGEGMCVTLVAPLSSSPCATLEEVFATGIEQVALDGEAPVEMDAVGSRAIRVLLADDHLVLRKELADHLRTQSGIEVVGEARDGQEAVEMALQTRPDIVLMDVTMPRMDGITATRVILAQLPHVRVIGLSMHEEKDLMVSMREAGAVAYLTKDLDVDAVVAAILAEGSQRAPLDGRGD